MVVAILDDSEAGRIFDEDCHGGKYEWLPHTFRVPCEGTWKLGNGSAEPT